MTPEEREIEKLRLLESVIEIEPDGRQRHLEQICDDQDLREEVLEIMKKPPMQFSGDSVRAEYQESETCEPLLTEGQEFGKYRIVRRLGYGGAGQVYLARDNLQRSVALKVLMNRSRASADRLRDEASVAASLVHDNIVRIHQFDEVDGLAYIEMEYVKGKTLRNLIGAGINTQAALRISRQVADGLKFAHEKGILHRDIKPENVLVTEDGTAKIADFGLAKITSESLQKQLEIYPTQTGRGFARGTVAYMSPEQLEGSDVDELTDVWSLGVMLYELLVGYHPFESNNITELIAKILRYPPRPVQELAPPLKGLVQALITKALAKEKKDRYSSIAAFAQDITDFENAYQLGSVGQLSPVDAEFADDGFFDEFDTFDGHISEENFRKFVADYSPDLPNEQQRTILLNVIWSVWEIVAFRPVVALQYLRSRTGVYDKLANILNPICNIALGNEIASSDIGRFIKTVLENKSFSDAPETRVHDILLVRFLRRVLYSHQQNPSAIPEEVYQSLEQLSQTDDKFWKQASVDLYFRDACGSLKLSSPLRRHLESLVADYLADDNAGALKSVAQMVLNPLDVAADFSRTAFVEKILDIAGNCHTSIERKWCIQAAMRVLPLFQDLDDEIDHSELIVTIIKKYGADALNKSRSLLFFYLKERLRSFVRTKKLKYLNDYENLFLRRRHHLNPPQLTQLQIEYAGCVYFGCQILDRDELEELSFVKFVKGGANILDEPLFRNELITENRWLCRRLAQPLNFNANGKGVLFSWLVSYTSELYRQFAKRRIEEDPLTVSNFKCAAHVNQIRPRLSESIKLSLGKCLESEAEFQAGFWARATRAFSLISASDGIGLMRAYLPKALQSDEYSIQRSAKDIGRLLFSCYYYGKQDDRNAIVQLGREFAERTKVGKGVPKFHWAYFAGTIYGTSPVEREFVSDLFQTARRKVNPKVYKLSGSGIDDDALEIPDEIVRVIKIHSERNSFFAQALGKYLNSSELWNLIGTTVMENALTSDTRSLEKAALFYSFAKCFARSFRDYDQKFCYNYIYVRGHYFNLTKKVRDNSFISFIRDTINYLAGRPDSKFFSFKEERVEPFINALSTSFETIDPDLQKLVREKLLGIDWIKKRFKNQFKESISKHY